MLKDKKVIEVKSGDRIYQLEVCPEASLGEVYDAICQMLSFIAKRINDSVPKKEEAPKEE